MEGRQVCIEDISLFVEQKSRALNDPVFGKLPCLTKEKKNSKDKGTKSKGDGPGAKQLSFVTLSDKNPPNPSDKNPPNPVKEVSGPPGSVTNPADSSTKNCPFCRETHNLSDCPSFAKVPDQERFDFLMKQRLCFSCLRGGHQFRGCYKKKPCTHCHGRHATVMHVHPLENGQVQPRPEVGVREAPAESGGNRAQGNVVPTGTQQGSTERFCDLTRTTMEGSVAALPIVPVQIKVRGSPHCIETYALLDNGSNSTFCSVSLLERLRINGKKTRLKLITMGRSEEVESLIVRDLVVSDLDENVLIPLHEVLSRPVMPVARDEIPRQEDVERWPHLRGHMYLTELDSQVDLLIGADVPEALQPREVIPAIDGGPYATRVDLGWVMNGPTGRKPKYVPSSCFFVKSVQAHPMCVACADFTDAFLTDDQGLSRDDLKSMNIVEDSVTQCEYGHYQVPLPLSNPRVSMPENRVQAERRVLCLKRKFSRDPKFRDDYVAFLEEVLQSIPVEERAMDIKELDLTKDTLPAERAFGVSWFVETDTFGFKISVKERTFTRRGILSVVSSVYDPLGMAAPFILPAKLLLQDLCRKGLGWDDEILSSFLPRWRMWLDGLPKLFRLSVDRCVRPIDFRNVVSRQIHHFCDASQSTYGAVSYLRLVNSDGPS